MVVMRHMRPWGHLGLLLTQGLPWTVAAIAIRPAWGVVLGYLGTYVALRLALTWTIAIWGLKLPKAVLKKALLIPVWDAAAFGIWLISFLRNRIRWRGCEYQILNGELVPVAGSAEKVAAAPDGRSPA
jgi:ceramide glucosyltransferase